ncbi:MAG TPA: hypothetical protein VFA15_08215, partial [Nitrososphaera sp.]|nr:hypothetical protein [Nitrososphaera sp.]
MVERDKPAGLLSRKGNQKNLMIGSILAAAGGAILVLSYVLSSLVLTFIGLGLALWSVITFYATPAGIVSEEVFMSVSTSFAESLQNVITNLGYRGKPIYLHPKSLEGLKRGYVFVSKDGSSRIPSDSQFSEKKIIFENPEGVLIEAPSQGLVDLLEEKLNINFATSSLSFMQEHIP